MRILTVAVAVAVAVAVVVGGLAACANTGAMQIGKDTYSISVRVPFRALLAPRERR